MNSSSMYISVCRSGLILQCLYCKTKNNQRNSCCSEKNRLVDIFLQESYQGIKVFITFANDYKAVIVSD